MIQVITARMAATLKASTEGLNRIDKARCKKGWKKTEKVWAELAVTSQSTLRRFWAGVAIQSEAFKEICLVVGIEDWESVVDSSLPISNTPVSSERLAFAIAGSIEKIDKSKLDAIVALLRQLGGDANIEILDIEEGSIKLTLGGSSKALRRIEELFESGEITEVLGISVQDVHFISSDELCESIKADEGGGFNLAGVDLRRARLNGANLSNANLSNANLSAADLRDANLNSANLSGADLSGINLHRANLSNANLSGANLSTAFLRGAYLSGANLRSADLSNAILNDTDMSDSILIRARLIGANLRNATLSRSDLSFADLCGVSLISTILNCVELTGADVTNARFGKGLGLAEEEKQDLKSRGAVFDDTPGDREFFRAPVPSGRR